MPFTHRGNPVHGGTRTDDDTGTRLPFPAHWQGSQDNVWDKAERTRVDSTAPFSITGRNPSNKQQLYIQPSDVEGPHTMDFTTGNSDESFESTFVKGSHSRGGGPKQWSLSGSYDEFDESRSRQPHSGQGNWDPTSRGGMMPA